MKKNVLKLGLATIVAFLLATVLSSYFCPDGQIPKCPFPEPQYATFFPHPGSCRHFFHCSNGVAYCKKCPADLHWNVELETCDYPYRAGCA